MKFRFLTAALLCALSMAHAGQTASPIIVTASRVAETADESLAPVTVITREDIERTQTSTIPELLNGQPGLTVTNNGGLGKTTSVHLRGTESDHVLVLVDGIKIGSATSGQVEFGDLALDQVERIEIVRGPRSSLYGSEAIGGIIQIFTRKGGGPLHGAVSITRGSYNTWQGSANLSGGGEKSWYNVAISGVDTDGFNACNGKPFPDGGGCFTVEPDEDGYRNRAASVRGGITLGADTELELHSLYTEAHNEFDGSFQNESFSIQQTSGARFAFAPADFWSASLALGRSRDDIDSFKDGDFSSRFNTDRDSASFQNDFAISDTQLLTLGFDYQEDKVETTAYQAPDRGNRAYFGQYRLSFGASDLQLALRNDDNDQFGDHQTGNVALGHTLENRLRITAAYGTAFKAPTFNELFFPFFGNPDARPEKARSTELGLSRSEDWGRWSINAYQTELDDLLAYDAATMAVTNVDTARIRGIEAELNARFAEWEMAAALTLLDPRNLSAGANEDNLLPRRAEQALRLDLDRAFGAYRAGTTLVAESRRYDDLANERTLDAYTTIDLRADYTPAPAWRVGAKVANVTDEQYETAAFYNQPERSYYLTLTYRQ